MRTRDRVRPVPTVQVIDVLAAYRLTRLTTTDTITRPARVRVIRYAYGQRQSNPAWLKRSDGEVTEPYWRGAQTESEWDRAPHDDDDAPKLAAFIICPWCVGFWISGFVVVARRYAPRIWDPVARALATSAAAALLARLEDQ